MLTSTSFNCDGPMSHWDATRVTQAFKRAENAGKGFENITAKLPGSHGGNNEFNTLLLVDSGKQETTMSTSTHC